MRIIVKYEGDTYTSKESSEDGTAEDVKELIYRDFGQVEKFTVELEDGGHLILGPDAVKRAAIIVKD